MAIEELATEVDEDALWASLDKEDADEPIGSLTDVLVTDAPGEKVAAEAEAAEAGFPEEIEEQPEPVAEAAAAPEKPDPIAELHKTIQALQAELQNGLRQVNGKVGGLQDTVKQMRTVQAEAAVAKATVTASGPTGQEIKDAQKSIAEWEALKADFPDWAAGVEKFVAAQVQAAKPAAAPAVDINALKAELKQEFQQTLEQQREAEKQQIAVTQRLDEAYPGWVETINSPEFVTWQKTQPKGIQALAFSDDPDDALAMLKLFRPPATVTSEKTAAQVAAERKQRLSQSVSPTKAVAAGPRNAVSFDDLTEDQQWAYLDRLDAQKAARRQPI